MPIPSKNIRAERIIGTLDASEFNISGNLLISGNTQINGGLTANTISATTIYADYIDFNTGATVTSSNGRIYWDSGTGTLNVSVGDTGTGLIDLQVGQEEIVRVFNDEATTLQKGEIVYVSGSQGNRPAVKRAQATSDGYSVTTLGMVDRNIASGAEGYVTTFGIISNLNTLGLTGGTAIWLSGTVPGGYTSVKPIAPLHTVLIGYVVRVSATVGSIFVNISNGWELDELHDVRISAATEGDLLMRSSFSGTPLWVNTKTLNGSYTITSTSAVTIDLTNNRVGIGTSLPQETLHISGTSRFDNDVTIWDDGVFNGNSRKLYFRGLGQTGNTQTGEIYLDAYGGTNGEILELRSGGGVRLGATGIDGTIQVYNFASNYPIIQSVQSGGLGLNVNSTTSGFTFTQGYTQTTGDLFSIYNSGPTKVFSILASNGNVGIGLTGTTSPTAKLHINNTTSGNTFLAEDDTNPDSSPFVIDSSGNTGIGTLTPISKLHVQNGQTTLVQPQGSDYIVFSSSTIANSGQTMYIRQTATNQYTFGTNLLTSFMKVGPTNVVDFSNQLIQTNGGTILGTIRSNTPYILNLNEIPSGITAGTQDYRGVLINPTVNFGGTYSGNFIGYLHNPTITSMANGRHIAMQIVSGDVLLNTTSGNVGIGTTTPRQKLDVSGNTIISSGLTAQTAVFSSSSQNVLTVIGSGNSATSPIFSVQGSSGELFSVSDSLTGSLFSVNDISGLPIVEVFSDNTTLMGSYLAPSLNTTTRTSLSAGTNTIYSIPTSAYTGAFFEYTLISTGSTGARAGQIMSIWSGTTAQFTETSTLDIGSTTGVTFNVIVSGNNALLRSSATTAGWTVKTIVRSI